MLQKEPFQDSTPLVAHLTQRKNSLLNKIQSFSMTEDDCKNRPCSILLIKGELFSSESESLRKWCQEQSNPNKTLVYIRSLGARCPPQEIILNAVNEYGLVNRQFIESNKNKIILLLDDYHQHSDISYIHLLGNLKDYGIEKIIVICKETFLELHGLHGSYQELLVPRGYGGSEVIEEYQLQGLSEEEIKENIRAARTQGKEGKEGGGWSESQHEKVLELIPGLKELLRYPYMLMKYVAEVEKIIISTEEEAIVTASIELYEYLMKEWICAQVDKLERSGRLVGSREEMELDCWEYAETLANSLYEGGEEETEIEIEGRWEELLKSENERISRARDACPLECAGRGKLKFTSRGLQGYLAWRANSANGLKSKRENNLFDRPVQLIQEMCITNISDDELNRELIVGKQDRIRFEADLLQKNSRRTQYLIALVTASKNSENYTIGATNAMTILNAGGIFFTDWNLSGARLSVFDVSTNKTIGADLSGSFCDNTNFENANLEFVNMEGAWLRNANMRNTYLANTNFGYPIIHGRDFVHCIYRPDIDLMVTLEEDGLLNVINLQTFEVFKKFSNIGIKTFDLSENGNLLLIGCENGDVYVIDIHDDNASFKDTFFELNSPKKICLTRDSVCFLILSNDILLCVEIDMLDRKLKTKFKRAIECHSLHLIHHTGVIIKANRNSDDINIDVSLLSLKSGELNLLDTFNAPKGGIHGSCISSNGKKLAIGCDDWQVRIWDLENLKQHPKILFTNGRAHSLSFDESGKVLLAGTLLEGYVTAWDVDNGSLLEVPYHIDDVSPTAFISRDGKTFAVFEFGGLQILNIFSSRVARQPVSYSFDSSVNSLLETLSNNHELVKTVRPYQFNVGYAIATKHGIMLVNKTDLSLIARLDENHKIIAMHANTKCNLLLSLNKANELKLWNIESNPIRSKTLPIIEREMSSSMPIALSKDGKKVAIGHDKVKIYSLDNLDDVVTIDCIPWGLCFLDECILTSGMYEIYVSLWNMNGGCISRIYTGLRIVQIMLADNGFIEMFSDAGLNLLIFKQKPINKELSLIGCGHTKNTVTNFFGCDISGAKKTTPKQILIFDQEPDWLSLGYWFLKRHVSLAELDKYLVSFYYADNRRAQIENILNLHENAERMIINFPNLLQLNSIKTACIRFLLDIKYSIKTEKISPISYYKKLLDENEFNFKDEKPRYDPKRYYPPFNKSVICFVCNNEAGNHRDYNVPYQINPIVNLLFALGSYSNRGHRASNCVYFNPEVLVNDARSRYKHLSLICSYARKTYKQVLILATELEAHTSDYVLIMIFQDSIIYVNPKGEIISSETYNLLALLQREYLVRNVFVSTQNLARDNTVSGGPICIELLRIFKSLPDLIDVIDKIVIYNARHMLSGLKYSKIDISHLLHNTMLEDLSAASDLDYQARITEIRNSHCKVLERLGDLEAADFVSYISDTESHSMFNLFEQFEVLSYEELYELSITETLSL